MAPTGHSGYFHLTAQISRQQTITLIDLVFAEFEFCINMALLKIIIGLAAVFLYVRSSSGVQFVIKAMNDEPEKENVPVQEGQWSSAKSMLPAVINTWAFTNATKRGIISLLPS